MHELYVEWAKVFNILCIQSTLIVFANVKLGFGPAPKLSIAIMKDIRGQILRYVRDGRA